jgi:hypothetical protein
MEAARDLVDGGRGAGGATDEAEVISMEREKGRRWRSECRGWRNGGERNAEEGGRAERVDRMSEGKGWKRRSESGDVEGRKSVMMRMRRKEMKEMKEEKEGKGREEDKEGGDDGNQEEEEEEEEDSRAWNVKPGWRQRSVTEEWII